jgi:hypothetical protein
MMNKTSDIYENTRKKKQRVAVSDSLTEIFNKPRSLTILYAPSSSLLQGKHLPFSPSPLRLNSFHFFVILSLTQLYRYTPEISLL